MVKWDWIFGGLVVETCRISEAISSRKEFSLGL